MTARLIFATIAIIGVYFGAELLKGARHAPPNWLIHSFSN